MISKKKNIEYIQVKIADIKFEIECINRNTFKFLADYMSSFEKPDYIISIKKEDIDAERRIISKDTTGSLVCVTTDSDLEIEKRIVHTKIAEILPSFNTLLMHGAVVSYNNLAYMFMAPSGTGKTTRVKYWLEQYPGSIVVNGDKPMIRILDSGIYACGSPWSGKEGWNTNIIVPLHAIFLLERSDENECSTIEELSISKAFINLYQQTYCPASPEMARKSIELLKKLDGKVRLFKFCSTLSKESVCVAYEEACPK